jgi:hypothetical protein
VFHFLRQCQGSAEVGEIVGQRTKLDSDGVVAQPAARQPRQLNCGLAPLDPNVERPCEPRAFFVDFPSETVRSYVRPVGAVIKSAGLDEVRDRLMKAYDLLVQAKSGLCSVAGTRRGTR